MSSYQQLIDGYHRWRRGEMPRHRGDWLERAEGQSPPVMIVSCVDSRVDPGTIFGCEPGEAFIHRNVANLVPPPGAEGHDGVLSAIEFGVVGLDVSHLVVMGHSGCGGIAASLAGETDFPSVDRWVELAAPAREEVIARNPKDPQRALEEAAIRHSLANLAEHDFIAKRLEAGELALHGLHFDIGAARLSELDFDSGTFNPE